MDDDRTAHHPGSLSCGLYGACGIPSMADTNSAPNNHSHTTHPYILYQVYEASEAWIAVLICTVFDHTSWV